MPNLADVVTVRWVLAGLAVVFLICGTGLLWAAEDQTDTKLERRYNYIILMYWLTWLLSLSAVVTRQDIFTVIAAGMFVSLATYRDGNDASFASINSCRVQSYDSGSRNLKECASGGALAMAGVLLGIMAGSPRPKWDETPLLDKILTVLVAAMTLTGCIVLWVSDGAQIAFTKYNELMDASIFAFLAAYYLVGSMLSRSRPLLTGTAFFISFVLVGHLATLFTVTNEATLDDLALVRTGFSISWSALFLGLVVVVRALWILDDQKTYPLDA